jgi:hypothetical protein
MYTYGQVVRALAEVFHIPSERMMAFRARIKNFQRVGISMSSPGKGKKIQYSFENAFLLALTLEFSEFGIDPTFIAKILKHLPWKSMDGVVFSDEYLVFYPEILSAPQTPTRPEGRIPYWWKKDRVKLAEFVAGEVVSDDAEPNVYDRRLGIIHTGLLRRKLERALVSADDSETPAA